MSFELSPAPADASRRVNVTCAELSNATFTNAPPFDVLGVPECGDAVQPELVLYLPDNGTSSSRCAYLGPAATALKSECG